MQQQIIIQTEKEKILNRLSLTHEQRFKKALKWIKINTMLKEMYLNLKK